jgi:hypothetical protein
VVLQLGGWKAGQRQIIKIGYRSFESVVKFKYLGTTLTDQNCIQEETKGRLNSGNACYHSVQSLLSSRLLSRNVKVKVYKTTILPVVLYGCETWSLTLRELHNEELHNLYSSPDIITQIMSRRMRWAGHVACMGEETKVYNVLVGKPEGRRPLGRPRRRWEDGIRMDLREIGLGGVDWIRLAQDRDR